MNPTESEYRFRINKAQDYIERKLEKQISLEELAEVANFSKFHFNRIFKSLVGETPFQFITRLRMQRGVNLLCANQYTPIHQIASEDKLRMSICLTAPEDIKTDGEIGKMEIAGGTYAVAHFEIDATQFEQAWDWVYSKWLPSSGYQPDENQCFELYPKAPENGRFTVDICIPVRPL